MIPVHTTNFSSDTSTTTDDNTAPSSAANTAERGPIVPGDHHTIVLRHDRQRSRSLTRLIDHTRRRLGRKDSDEDDDDDDEGPPSGGGALIAGYLQKLGRNGKWQTRWFETDGECLSYYKTSMRYKLLATLDLQKVIVTLCYFSLFCFPTLTYFFPFAHDINLGRSY